MKVRNIKRHYYYSVIPYLDKFPRKEFKTMRNVMRYLRSMGVDGEDALNSIVNIEVRGINFYHTSHQLFVWFNQHEHIKHGHPFKLVLKKELFRGRKYIFGKGRIDKETLRYFTKSEQIFNLMIHISNLYDNGEEATDSNLKNLIRLFKYRFGELPDNDGGYGHGTDKLKDCEWSYWSDRCGYQRASTVVKCIRNERPHLL